MTIYRVIIDGQETGEPVIAASYADAYFDVASTMPLTYQTDVKLIAVEQTNDNPSIK
ncbi:hypothetical protein [Sporomusa sp.]|jgi:hypothetical protein|uniref:hypothetical protein n=1 Tax=Sporomusa sp. TaxID=2078658 RepID=UPI002C5DD9A1|nr:hypothetical protein [Sporomusa sp.]MDF2874080.1 hypothetical protein [Sporomusa sp.]HWR07936.1 hypothetical protein [Sporomusa sp.]